jgi:hypothetical protein
MARYKRYTYVLVQTEIAPGQGVKAHANLSVFPKPEDADVELDKIIKHREQSKRGVVTSNDRHENLEGYAGELVRQVFIRYPDKSKERFRVERWFIWYGRS